MQFNNKKRNGIRRATNTKGCSAFHERKTRKKGEFYTSIKTVDRSLKIRVYKKFETIVTRVSATDF